MTDASYSADPSDNDDAPPDGVDLNRTLLAGDPFSSGTPASDYVPGSLRVDLYGNPVDHDPYFPDPNDPTLDGGRVLYHMAFGAKPEDFHPALQPLAGGYSIAFEPQPPMGPGLLGSLDDIRAAIAAQPADVNDDDDIVSATPPAHPLNLDTTIPDLGISPTSAPAGPLGLQDVDGLPIQSGSHAISRFDRLIAPKVSSFFKDLGDRHIPIQLTGGFRPSGAQAQYTNNKYGARNPATAFMRLV